MVDPALLRRLALLDEVAVVDVFVVGAAFCD